MTAHSYSPLQENRRVLSELLHSVSQPLTTLRCSLELSLDETAECQQQNVAAALEQTENVIEMIQLMREYLDADERGGEGPAIAVQPILRSVIDHLSPLAGEKQLRLQMSGSCAAALPIREPWMRRALEYLISAMIARQASGEEITVLLDDNPSGTRVWIHGKPRVGPMNYSVGNSIKRDSMIQRVRLAIATRVLEGAGGTLDFVDDGSGFLLHIPRPGTRAGDSPRESAGP